MAKERLQKVIAQAGVCSRRQAEKLISSGQVKVNGRTVRELGVKVNPGRDQVEVNGRRLKKPDQRYILFHKPSKCVTTHSDECGRETVYDYIKGVQERIFSVGRLDFDTEGLLLLTNDGGLAHALTHPSGEVKKTYQVKISGIPSLESLEQLQTGVMLEDGPAQVSDVFMIQPGRQVSARNTWLEMTVTEGRNRLIRRMMEQMGYQVLRLRRTRFASLELPISLKPGQWMNLNKESVRKLEVLAKAAEVRRQRFQKKQQEQNEDKDWFGF